MSYKVVAALVLAKDRQGIIHYVYEGGVIAWLSPEQADHFLSEGLVVQVDGGGEEASEGDSEEAGDEVPLRAAPKANWVDYAVSVHGVDRDEAEALNKQELIDLYGG